MSHPKIDDLASALHELLRDAESLLGDRASEGIDSARESLEKARDHLRAAQEEVAKHARTVDRAVHDHPWKAMLATGIAGFLLGMLVRRR
jgi:ElaB/YqjD/DUF883 family membrane-anchored ribosome-binding protein